MRAEQILHFGPPSAIVSADVSPPVPAAGEVLVRVKAAGVGPWDALIREGKSAIPQSFPLILGSDLSGIVESLGPGASDFKPGDEVYGSTNDRFVGAYAEFARASAAMLAPKPKTLSHIEAASVPVVAVTAWQMLFDYAHATPGQTVLIHAAAGNVGAYAVQLAKRAQLHVIATASARDADYVRNLGAEKVIDYRATRFEEVLAPVDAVLDLVGGETQARSLRVLRPNGILVSVVSAVPEATAKQYGVRAVFFYVAVTTVRLNALTDLFDSRQLTADVGTVLPLEQARVAHEMLAGAPHNRGKIVLQVTP